jgi:hypothetical protein
MELKKQLIKRNIAGDYILVPVGNTILNTSGMFILNEVGAFIWDALPAVNTENEILDLILKEFDVDADQASQDVAEFMQQLKDMDII